MSVFDFKLMNKVILSIDVYIDNYLFMVFYFLLDWGFWEGKNYVIYIIEF